MLAKRIVTIFTLGILFVMVVFTSGYAANGSGGGRVMQKLNSLYQQKKSQGCDMTEADKLIALMRKSMNEGDKVKAEVSLKKLFQTLKNLKPSAGSSQTGDIDPKEILTLYAKKEKQGCDMLEVEWLLVRAQALNQLGEKTQSRELLKEALSLLKTLDPKEGVDYHKSIGNPFSNPMGIYCFGAERNAYIMADLGVKWTRERATCQQTGSEGNKWGKFPTYFQNTSQVGIQMFPVILFTGGGETSKGRDRPVSQPPSDLTDKEDKKWGYSKTYYQFITDFVKEFQQHLAIIAIENEASAPYYWRGTKEDYIKILKTAYKASHKVKPGIKVSDSGFMSEVLGMVIARDYLESGKFNEEEAFSFLKGYYQNCNQERFVTGLSSIENMKKLLYGEEASQHYAFVTYCMKNFKGCIDVLNFHYYEGYEFLPMVVEWFENTMKKYDYEVPLVCNEMGIHNIVPNYDADGLQMADEFFKKAIVAWTLGVKPIIWFPFGFDSRAKQSYVGENIVGFFNKNYEPRPAMNALKFLGAEMGSEYKFDHQETTDDPSFYYYIFRKKGTPQAEMHILWKENAEKDFSIAIKPPFTKVSLFNVVGEGKTWQVENGEEIKTTVVNSPVIILFH